jgi:hypothetical protein
MLPSTTNFGEESSPIITVSPNPMMAESFLRRLFNGAPRGHLTVTCKHGDLMLTEFIDISLISMDQVAVRACKSAAVRDVYFGVGLRAERLDGGRRGDADSVIVLPGLWIDSDIKGPAHKELALPPDEEAAMRVLRAAGIEPTLVVTSGYGLHGYYLFNQPLLIEAGNRQQVKTVSANFHNVAAAVAREHGWKIDNVSDLARILRPAGSVNWKDPQNPKLVTYEHTDVRYDIAEIEEQVRPRLSQSVGMGFEGFEGFVAQPAVISESQRGAAEPDTVVQGQAGRTALLQLPLVAFAKTDFPPALIEPIVKGCAWVCHCRDDAATLPEPQWHAVLSVLGRCEDGERLAHEWSRPYPKYTFVETEKKLRHALEDAGPVTCDRVMEGLGQQEYCGECLFRPWVKSPITIGMPAEIEMETEPASIRAGDEIEGSQAIPTTYGDAVPVQLGNTGGSATLIPAVAQEERPASGDTIDTPRAAVVTVEHKSTQPQETSDSTKWPELKRIHATLPPVPEFDPELLPGAFRDHAVDLADRMQVPLDFPAAALMVGLGSVVGRRATITPKESDHSWCVFPNLWGGIVSRPGNLKSPLVKEVFRPLQALEIAAIAKHEAEMEEYEKELEAWEMRKKKAYGPKGSGVFDDPKPKRPPGTRYLLNDATIEKLHAIHVDNPQGVFLNRDELAGFLATLDTKGRERDRPFFLEGWNGDSSYTIDRIGRGTLFVPHLCISLFGGIQPAKLQSYLSGAVVGGGDDDGLAQRLQIIVWPDQGAKYQNVDRAKDAAAAHAVEAVFRRISEMPVEEPFRARFDPEAQEMFNAWREELENRVRNGKLPRHMESHLAKYRSLMPSLSLLLHLADGSTVPVVPLVQAQRAADWCVYLEEHAKRVYSCVTSFADRAAATLAERIRKGALGKTFTANDVYLKGWANLTKTDSIMLALGVLQDAGWVRVIPRTLGIRGGRPTEDYIVNPAVFHE